MKLRKNEKYSKNEELILSFLMENQDYLYKMSFIYLKNSEDALENVQEVAYKAWKYKKKLKDKNLLKTWITKILINCALDKLKSRKEYISFTSELPENHMDTEGIEFEELVINNLFLDQLITSLSVEEKTVITLRFYNDLSLKEISQITNSSMSQVKNILYRSLKKIKNENHVERGTT